jgi:hypothetical protein
MIISDFFSQGRYINLPFPKKRVSLFVDNGKFFDTTSKLYQPFSRKAIYFKKGCLFLFKFSPRILKLVSIKHEKGEFIKFIEKQLSKELISSIYYPTIPDKLVLQLLSKEGSIYGYAKIGINKKGNAKIVNERNAIALLYGNIKLIDSNYLIDYGKYYSHEYIIVKELIGTSTHLDENEIHNVLEKLINKEGVTFKTHSGFNNLLDETSFLCLKKLTVVLKKISNNSKEKYGLVYEHGDFVPWNIIRDEKGKIKLFDFEYFLENGIQYMDEFNYHYQTGKLLKKLNTEELILYLKEKIDIEEFYMVFGVFLIRKIVQKTKEGSNSLQELNVLNHISINIE